MGDRVRAKEVLDCIAAVEAENNSRKIVRVFSKFVEKLGFRSVALGYIVNPEGAAGDDPFDVADWNSEWVQRWRISEWIIHDPIARYALRSRQTFTWRAAYEHAMTFGTLTLDEIDKFGFADGLAIPVWTPGRPPGCISMGADEVNLTPKEQMSLELVAIHIYVRIEHLVGPRPLRTVHELTRRETQVIHHAARGKTNREIAVILSLSEATVREYVSSAIAKLNCANRAQAVAVAIKRALIIP